MAHTRTLPLFFAAAIAVGTGCASDSANVDTRNDGAPQSEHVFLVVSGDGLPHIPPPAASCPAEGDVDSSCDHLIPLDCAQRDERIDFDPADGSPCPICVEPGAGDPTTCEAWRRRYLEFLADNISQSCINACTAPNVCGANVIVNSCGTVAVPLSGYLNEEPIEFAREFARTNCAPACGFVEQTTSLSAEWIRDYDVACVDSQCVFVAAEDDGEPSPDAAP